MKKTLVGIAILLTTSTYAIASVDESIGALDFYHTDLYVDGDNLVTVIQDTGFEWINLTQTNGYSILTADAETEQGGVFEGWRLPSFEDMRNLQTLIYPQLYTVDLNDTSVQATYNDNQFLAEAFGYMIRPNGKRATWGVFQTNEGERTAVFGILGDIITDTTRIIINYSLPAAIDPLISDFIGHVNYRVGVYSGIFLIRDISFNTSISKLSDVNAPITGAALISMMCLMGMGRRKT